MSDVENIVSAMRAAAEADSGEEVSTEESSVEGEPQEGGAAEPGPDLGAAALAEARSRAAREAEAQLQREAEQALEEKRTQVEERESRLQALAKDSDVVGVLKELGFDAADRKAIAEMMYIQEMGDAAPKELQERLGDIKERSKLQKLEAEVERLRLEREEEEARFQQEELIESYSAEIMGALEESKDGYKCVSYMYGQDAQACEEQLGRVAEMLFEANGVVAEPEEVLQAANDYMMSTLKKWEGYFQGAEPGDESKSTEADSQTSTITSAMTGAGPMGAKASGLEDDEYAPDVSAAIAAMQKAAREQSG